jgi:hypothetical protein
MTQIIKTISKILLISMVCVVLVTSGIGYSSVYSNHMIPSFSVDVDVEDIYESNMLIREYKVPSDNKRLERLTKAINTPIFDLVETIVLFLIGLGVILTVMLEVSKRKKERYRRDVNRRDRNSD